MKRWHVLAKLAKERGSKKGAEIGALNGATLFYILDECQGLHMIAVDQWIPYPGSLYSPEDLVRAKEEFLVNARLTDRVSILQGDSVEMAAYVPDASLDFVFIDADHRTESVLADIHAWVPKVRSGGFVAGHDIDWGSVREAVNICFLAWAPMPDDVWLAERADYQATATSK